MRDMMDMKDIKGAMQHFRKHQAYPATKNELVAECNNLSDFSENDKMWFSEQLPEGTYNSAADVAKALGWEKEAGSAYSMA